MLLSGMVLLQAVAERIIGRYLEGLPGTEVVPADGYHSLGGRGADLVYVCDGRRTSVKVKPDSYFGTDATKVRERAWSFYREDAGVCALEAVAGSSMRDPGWMFTSDADEIFYYYLAIGQPEDEVRALGRGARRRVLLGAEGRARRPSGDCRCRPRGSGSPQKFEQLPLATRRPRWGLGVVSSDAAGRAAGRGCRRRGSRTDLRHLG